MIRRRLAAAADRWPLIEEASYMKAKSSSYVHSQSLLFWLASPGSLVPDAHVSDMKSELILPPPGAPSRCGIQPAG